MEKQNSKLSLYEKLHKVMEALDFIEKDKKNIHFNYTYASEASIKKAVHSELVKQKLLFVTSQDTLTRTEKVVLNKEGKEVKSYLTDVKVMFGFIDVETGERIEGYAYGTGEDSSDKGTYKAITGAIKYILTSTFLIPTGDDPEKDEKQANKKEAPKAEAKSSGKIQPNEKANLVEMTDAVCKKYCERILNGEKVGEEIAATFILTDKHRDMMVDAMNKRQAQVKKGVAA